MAEAIPGVCVPSSPLPCDPQLDLASVLRRGTGREMQMHRQAGVWPASSAAWGMEACLELGGGVKRREDLQGGEGWFVLSRRMRR